MSKANSWIWSFFPFSFQRSLHSNEPLVWMQITWRSTFESTLFCQHAVFSSVNSSQKSFRPHFMIFKCMLVMCLRSVTREISEDICAQKRFSAHHQENPRNCLLNLVGMHPIIQVCQWKLRICNANTRLPVDPLRLYPFMVYSFQFTAFLHIRCIYSRNQEHEVLIWVNKIRIWRRSAT